MSLRSPASERGSDATPLDSIALDVLALDSHPDPGAGLAAVYRRGGLISLPTAGTTGRPRRVIRTAASWADSFAPAAELAQLGVGDRVWVPGPVSATMNLYAVCLALHVGAVGVASVDQASHAFITPAALHGLADRADLDLHGLRLVVAGDELSPDLADRAERRGWSVAHYYGAAQLSFVAWGRDATNLRPFPGVEVDERDGELWVRSPWVCEREVVGPGAEPVLRMTDDGWATVGDRGGVLTDGTIGVDGRDDAVVTGGATVIVADVESTLRSTARGQVVVVGVPHSRLGQLVVAVCTDPADVARLAAIARRELPMALRPRRWLHRAALPLTSAGKLDRLALVSWAATR